MNENSLAFIEQDTEVIKALFSFNGDETQFPQLNEMFANYIKTHSENGCFYFIGLLDHYSLCRVYQHDVAKKLIDCLYSCFPDMKPVIESGINHSQILQFLSKPEYIRMDPVIKIFSLIYNDDIDGLISHLANNPMIDIHQDLTSCELMQSYYMCIAGLNVNGNRTMTPINISCVFGSLKCFKYFLVNSCEVTGKTLSNTIKGGNHEIIAVLSNQGFTFEKYLCSSIQYHRYEITKWLQENFKCEPVRLSERIRYFNFDGFYTPPRREINLWEFTCLHNAAIIGHLNIVKFLIANSAKIDALTRRDKTPLHFACTEGHFPVVQYLVENGANINAKDSNGKTPPDYAVFSDNLQVLKYLCEKGASIQSEGTYGPLHAACFGHKLPYVQYLIEECGIDINSQDQQGMTPLHWATVISGEDIIRYLLSKGADKTIKNQRGRTPYNIAWDDKVKEILK